MRTRMNKLTTNVFLTVALLFGLMIFASCGGAKTDANTATSNTTTSGDSVGVAECDEYIKKYEACLTSIAAKAPQAQPGLKTAFDAQRKGFKDMAANPQTKATLPATCKQAMDSTKQSTTAYGCAW